MNSNNSSDRYREKGDRDELKDLENLDKNELTKKAREDLNISDDEWKEKVEMEPMISEKTIEDIASINKYFVERIEHLLSGKTLVRTGKGEERWVQSDKAMAGVLLIKSCVGIIGTFANKSMLISGTKEEDFNMQFEDAFRKISNLIIMPQCYVDINSIRTILKQFKDTFWNLGAILTKTGRNMEAYFNALRNIYGETDSKIKSKLGDYANY